jgi:hypothetical protein
MTTSEVASGAVTPSLNPEEVLQAVGPTLREALDSRMRLVSVCVSYKEAYLALSGSLLRAMREDGRVSYSVYAYDVDGLHMLTVRCGDYVRGSIRAGPPPAPDEKL